MKLQYFKKSKSEDKKDSFAINFKLALILLISLSIIPFSSNLNGEFIFDDTESIVNNPVVNGRISIREIFTRDFWGRRITSPQSHKSFRPITTATFWLNYLLSPSPLGFHLVNIGLHTTATVILFLTVLELENKWNIPKSVAFPTATMFAVHPVHTEAIANITGRCELLSSIFHLFGLLFFIRSNSLAPPIILTFLSLFSKEQGIITLPCCLIFSLLDRRRLPSQLILCFSFFSLFVLRLSVQSFTTPEFTEFDNPAAFIENPWFRLNTIAIYWLHHIRLLFYPVSLCFDYSMRCIPTIQDYYDIRNLTLPFILFAVIFGLTAIYRLLPQEFRRISFLSISMAILTFLPASNLIFTVGFTVAERVLYLPSIGFCLLISIFLVNLPSQFRSFQPFLLTFLVFYGISYSYKRSSLWSSGFLLYSKDVSVCPNNAKIHYNLAKVLTEQGLTEEAEFRYRQAILLETTYAVALSNLGNLIERKGSLMEAEALFRRALSVNPTFSTAWMNLGINLMHQRRFNESEFALEQSIRIRPRSADSLFNLGNLYLRMEEKIKAKEKWMDAIRLNLSHSAAWNNLFLVLEELNECDTIFSLSPLALLHVSQMASLYSQRGLCFAKIREFAKAEEDFKMAIRISGNNTLYWKNLNILYSHWHPAHLNWHGSEVRHSQRQNESSCTIDCV